MTAPLIIPDIYGLKLEDAEKILENAGISDYRILLTMPPREAGALPEAMCRVVRCRIDKEGMLEIIVCKPL